MRNLVQAVTISGLSLLFLCCSAVDDGKEHISLNKVSSFSVSIDKIIEDKLTMVLVVDDSASMISKTEELETDMTNLFTDLINAQWDIDLHLVTCAFYKNPNSDMKSVSTNSFEGQTTEEKVAGLMNAATPKIDYDTLQNDADERCNQSLEKAWGIIEPVNKINLSLIISNEDGCGRDFIADPSLAADDPANKDLVHIDGSTPRGTCAPITYNQIVSTGIASLSNRPIEDWTFEVENYYTQTWTPWYSEFIIGDDPSDSLVHSSQRYVDFLKDLEKRGKETVESFSHIYLPIVVDSSQCLAETLLQQYEDKEEIAQAEARELFREEVSSRLSQNSNIDGPAFDQAIEEEMSNFVFNGLDDFTQTQNILGNIGRSYLETFELLNQDIEFNKEAGDLSLCNDLSHIVNKVSKEIQIRGNSIPLPLPAPIDVSKMVINYGENFKILQIIRPESEVEAGYFERQNQILASIGLEWAKKSDTHWILELSLNSGFVSYNPNSLVLELQPNPYVTINGGDEHRVISYYPTSFVD